MARHGVNYETVKHAALKQVIDVKVALEQQEKKLEQEKSQTDKLIADLKSQV